MRDAPSVEFQKEFFREEGEVRRGPFQVSIRSAKVKRRKYGATEPWHVEFTLEPGFDRDQAAGACSGPSTVDLTAGAQPVQLGGLPIQLREFYETSRTGNLVHGVAHELRHNLVELSSTPSGQTVFVRLPGAVAQPLYSIRLPHEEHGPPDHPALTLGTPLGKGQYAKARREEWIGIAGERGRVLFKEPTLQIEVAQPLVDLRDVETRLRPFLDALATVLSVLSRQQVGWSEMVIFSKITGEPGLQESNVWSPIAEAPPYTESYERLVDPRKLPADALDRLVSNLIADEARELIELSTAYVASAYRASTAESRILNAFTGLEALTHGWSRESGMEFSLPPDDFQQLRDLLQDHVRDWAKERGFDRHTRKAIYSKLGELRRPPLVPRIVAMIQQAGVEWDDLWVGPISLEAGIRNAYRRRSEFLHTGLPSQPDALVRDSSRVNCLTERLIFTRLGGDVDWVRYGAYARYRLLEMDR